mmetsp:Transcript_37586/g.124518  ORF Transcript_37586/g.124518 Transcript_37586/m.124518 type:complete len:219 (-) Transcript_37586:969-1625(-)
MSSADEFVCAHDDRTAKAVPGSEQPGRWSTSQPPAARRASSSVGVSAPRISSSATVPCQCAVQPPERRPSESAAGPVTRTRRTEPPLSAGRRGRRGGLSSSSNGGAFLSSVTVARAASWASAASEALPTLSTSRTVASLCDHGAGRRAGGGGSRPSHSLRRSTRSADTSSRASSIAPLACSRSISTEKDSSVGTIDMSSELEPPMARSTASSGELAAR